jgi:hypothetical protein
MLRRTATALATTAAATAVAAGAAWAAIPGPNAEVKGCYKTSGGALRVIDSAASCASGETLLPWTQRYEPGNGLRLSGNVFRLGAPMVLTGAQVDALARFANKDTGTGAIGVLGTAVEGAGVRGQALGTKGTGVLAMGPHEGYAAQMAGRVVIRPSSGRTAWSGTGLTIAGQGEGLRIGASTLGPDPARGAFVRGLHAGVWAEATATDGSALGVRGRAAAGSGVFGTSTDGQGIDGLSTNGIGVAGRGGSIGVEAISTKSSATSTALRATAREDLAGVFRGRVTIEPAPGQGTFYYGGGLQINGKGGDGMSVGRDSANRPSTGVYADGTDHGVRAYADGGGLGVSGYAPGGKGVYGGSETGVGVQGSSKGGYGLEGISAGGYGIVGRTSRSNSDFGVSGVFGQASAAGSSGLVGQANAAGARAATFFGNVATRADNFGGKGDLHVAGTLTKASGTFRIDHPLDPRNKVLSHSFVESPDMMNIYNGNVTTDDRGLATVRLPRYFEALNRDPRYQLTPIGSFARAVVWREVRDNAFVIRTDEPRVRVSWQVTGIRDDRYAREHPVVVEEDKRGAERGRLMHP